MGKYVLKMRMETLFTIMFFSGGGVMLGLFETSSNFWSGAVIAFASAIVYSTVYLSIITKRDALQELVAEDAVKEYLGELRDERARQELQDGH